jgi:hypothetical protein
VKKLGLVVLSHSYMLLRFLTGKVVAQERLVSKSCLVFATVKLRLVEALLNKHNQKNVIFDVTKRTWKGPEFATTCLF